MQQEIKKIINALDHKPSQEILDKIELRLYKYYQVSEANDCDNEVLSELYQAIAMLKYYEGDFDESRHFVKLSVSTLGRTYPLAEELLKQLPEEEAKQLKVSTGKAFGFWALVPFGWIAILVAMERRTKEVQNGKLDKNYALRIIKNYSFGFWIAILLYFILMVGSLLDATSENGGQNEVAYVNPIAIIFFIAEYFRSKHDIQKGVTIQKVTAVSSKKSTNTIDWTMP